MVEGGQLVVVGVACLRITTVQILGELQHIVGVTGLRAVDVVDEVDAGLFAGEVLATRVSAKGQRTLTGHNIPEEIRSLVIRFISCEFADTLKAYDFGHLRVGMHVIEAVLTL